MNDNVEINGLKRTGLIYVLAIILMSLLSVFTWLWLPAGEEVVVGIRRHGISYGSKAEALLPGPAIAAGLGVILLLILSIEPRRLNLRRSAKALSAVWLSLLAVVTVTHVMFVAVLLARPVNLQQVNFQIVFGVLMALLFMVIGNYMGKLRSNFFIGFRTPWTLSSERSWNKTQRLAGWLLVVFGVSVIPAAVFLGNDALIVYLLLGAGAIAAIGTVYSYFVWRTDPNKKESGH